MNRTFRVPWRNGANIFRYPRTARRHQSGQQPPKDEPIDIPSQLWYHRLGPVTDFFGWFHRTQQKRPLTVQLCTTTVVYFCGDMLAQEIGGEEYDGQRTLRMLTIGAVASIPGYKWFIFLGNNFNYASRWLSVAVKVVVQQAVFTPVFNSYFFGMQAVLTGEPPSGVIKRIKDTVPTSIVNSLKLWPAVTAFSFAYIIPQYRFMFSGIFAVCWQTYLSFLNRRAEKEEHEEPILTVKQ
ncbi:hypothetical protein PMZ80_010887 [Knufia obscura]|uniref:Uncharacterized protein n=2 Tax=Knufia TaxID=430999 RepID=A0AAN8I6M4_9EURO|nr:hypothetical protein PMZ80_010887 [Knufia obscura]KAK5951800.1 hypothetical protein OHC33_007092 [Knufia fluminis]